MWLLSRVLMTAPWGAAPLGRLPPSAAKRNGDLNLSHRERSEAIVDRFRVRGCFSEVGNQAACEGRGRVSAPRNPAASEALRSASRTDGSRTTREMLASALR